MTSEWSRPVDDGPRRPSPTGGSPDPARSELTIGIGRSEGTIVVRLAGALETLATAQLAPVLGDLIEGQGNLLVAVDLGAVQHVGPSGVRVLSDAARSLEGRGGRLALRGVRDGVLRALEFGGLARCIAFEQDDAKAARGALADLRARRTPGAHPAGSRSQPDRQRGKHDRA